MRSSELGGHIPVAPMLSTWRSQASKSEMKLALGTVQFGLSYGIANRPGQVTRQEVREMLQLAAAHGINTLDTAIACGESETCLRIGNSRHNPHPYNTP